MSREKLNKAYQGDITPEVRLFVTKEYKKVFGKDFKQTRCNDCIRDAAIELLVERNKSRKYVLHSGKSIQHDGKIYVQFTLTDDIARKYLKQFPEESVKFKVLP